MYQEQILICMTAPILGMGLQVQFYNWGFEQIELAADVEKAIESVERHTPTLLVLDADWPTTEQTFRLIQLVRRNSKSIPVIFLSKQGGKTLGWEGQLQWLSPFKWLSKPSHEDELWQAVRNMLPNISNSTQQS